MDRFLEEQEGVRDRSSSPNVNCLLSGDIKRQRVSTNSMSNDEPSTLLPSGKANLENWTNSVSVTTATVTATTNTSSGSDSSVNNAEPADSMPPIHFEQKNPPLATIAVVSSTEPLVSHNVHQQLPENKSHVDSQNSCEKEQHAVAANLSKKHTSTDIIHQHLPS